MQVRLRHVLISIAIVVLAFLSHGRLLGASYLGDDRAFLARVALDAGEGARAAWSADGDVRPVASALVRATSDAGRGAAFDGTATSAASATSAGASEPRAARITALVLLLAAAAGAGFALHRALQPWIGGDTARAAGFAAALFCATHPIGGAAVARPRALGDLAALVLCTTAAWAFLRGRQEREKWATGLALVTAIAAGFAAPIALLLPFVLFAAELSSTRRMRTITERARTAATTFLVFLAAVLVEAGAAALLRVPGRAGLAGATPDLPGVEQLGAAALGVVERLGILFLPVSGRDDGVTWPHYLLSVGIVLVALVPFLRSARAAPRLWGWIALVACAGTCLALVPHASVRVSPSDFTRADVLVVASWFSCAGLAVAATAQLGTRRIVLPAVLSLGFAWLGARGAGGFVEAGDVVRRVEAGVVAARTLVGPNGGVWIVDAPTRAGGLDLNLSSPDVFAAAGDARGPRILARATRAPRIVAREALALAARTDEFRAVRARGLALVEADSTASSPRRTSYAAHVVPPGAGDPPPFEWRAEVRSPLFERDLDPTRTHFARISAVPGSSVAEAPRLSWRTGGGAEEPPEGWPAVSGVWLAGEGAPVAVFDLSAREAWWRASGVRRVWTGGGLAQIDTARLVLDVPLELRAGDPLVAENGLDWTFGARVERAAQPLHGDARFVLELLDLDTLAFTRLECSAVGSGEVDGLLLVRANGAGGVVGAQRAVRRARSGVASSGGDLAPRLEDVERSDALVWCLERRVGDVAVARATGRVSLAP